MVTKQTVGKGLPTSAEILASSLSEHVNEAQLAWRPLCPWNEETVRFPLAVKAQFQCKEKNVISSGSRMNLSPLAGDTFYSQDPILIL